MTLTVRREFDAELQELKKKILTMGSLVESMVGDSLSALVTRNVPLAMDVEGRDRQVDRLEMDVDDLAAHIIALRQPTASDLRLIVAALKISTDLERMGDLAVNISERVVELNEEPQLKPYIDLPHMAEMVRAMIAGALNCFVDGNTRKAREILAADAAVDSINEQIFRELLTYMLEDPKTITRATRLIFIAKYLERLADHATNVAEEVIFAFQGRDVRHGNVGPAPAGEDA
jgi:phosphate transport system protein